MKRLSVLGCLVALAAVGAPKKATPPPAAPPALKAPSEKLAEALGGKVAEQLTKAAKIEIARTSYVQGIRPKPEVAIGSDFQRDGAWDPLDSQDVEKLRALLYDEKTFRLSADVTGCNFTPDVAFQMINTGLDTLQMLVSFKCNQVLFFTVKNGGRTVPGLALDFKPARKPLLALVKAVLREDAAVQGIK